MNNFFQFLLHFIFIATFLFIFIVAIIILKPFRTHRKRRISTIALKVSYLVYLAIFLLFVYLVLFFTGNEPQSEENLNDPRSTVYYVVVLLSFFIPNIGIMIRRKIKEKRIQYNWIITFVNLIFIFALIYLMNQIEWKF